MLQDSGDAEITDFDLSALSHEYILCFEVAMQDLAVVDVLNSQCHLDKPVKDLVLAVAHASNLLLVSDLGVEITAIRVVHDNT